MNANVENDYAETDEINNSEDDFIRGTIEFLRQQQQQRFNVVSSPDSISSFPYRETARRKQTLKHENEATNVHSTILMANRPRMQQN